MINGIIVINKEQGFTSFDVIAKLRGILHQKKIGHTGTLDPDATGVLPVCLGNATKLCDMLTDKKKEYIAEFVLGKTTDTQDISGKVLTQLPVLCKEDDVRKTIAGFVGEQEQIPPMYSAIKVNGKKLYELAREGKEIERMPRKIFIEELAVLSLQIPYVKMRILCSKGTYIRTLCHDIGQHLGCGAVMTSLERTRSGEFTKEKALTLKKIEELHEQGELASHIFPTDHVFMEYPEYIVRDEMMHKRVMNGNSIQLKALTEGKCLRIYRYEGTEKKFLALYRYRAKDKLFVPEKMFLE